MMKFKMRVCHALWHEFGHILFGDEKQFGINLSIDIPKRSSYAVLNELMAEYIAHYVAAGFVRPQSGGKRRETERYVISM